MTAEAAVQTVKISSSFSDRVVQVVPRRPTVRAAAVQAGQPQQYYQHAAEQASPPSPKGINNNEL